MKRIFLIIVIISMLFISACKQDGIDNITSSSRTDDISSQKPINSEITPHDTQIENYNELPEPSEKEQKANISYVDEDSWYDWENTNQFPINQSQCQDYEDSNFVFLDNTVLWRNNNCELNMIDEKNNIIQIDTNVQNKIYYDNDQVIYSKADGIYSASLNGTNKKKIISRENTLYLEYFVFKDYIYVYETYSKIIEYFNMEGVKEGEYPLPISIFGGEFYIENSIYFNGYYLDDLEEYGDSWFIYRLDLDNGKVEKCSPITAGNYTVVNNIIYYTDYGLNKIENGNVKVLLDAESVIGYETYFNMYRNYILFTGMSNNKEQKKLYAYDVNENKLFELFNIGGLPLYVTENTVFVIDVDKVYKLEFKGNTVVLRLYLNLKDNTFY